MTSADGVASGLSGGISVLPRRVVGNVRAWFETLGRAPRAAYVRSLSRTEVRSGLVVAAIAIVLVMRYVDAPAMAWARTLPGWLVAPLQVFTDFGKSGWFLWPLGLLLLAIAALDRPELAQATRLVLAALVARLGFVFLAIAAPGLFVTTIKRLIGRARPMVEGNHAIVFHPFAWNVEYASFPSGHATTAFTVVFAIGALWPAGRPLLWIYALAIAFSRVALNAHHPSDVLAGAVVAWIGVAMVRDVFASQRLVFTPAPHGVCRRPGPSWRRIKVVVRALVAHQCPASEVRDTLRHPLTRTSEAKRH
jgi:membrane-associated phospholipid phosphatase